MKEFAFLIVVAVLWYYAGPSLLVVAAVVLFIIGVVKFAERLPRTTMFLVGLFYGLFGRR